MKVILLRDVAKIGKKFSVVEVPDGFAQNKLIPRRDAEPATPAGLRRILEKQKGTDRTKEGEAEVIVNLHESSVALPIKIELEANEQGHLFKSVHKNDIVAAAKVQGLLVPEQFLKIADPIKTIGKHEVALSNGTVTKNIFIEVVAKNSK